MIETSLSTQHILLAQIQEAPPRDGQALEPITFLPLTPELSNALNTLKTFSLSKAMHEPEERNPSQVRALDDLYQLLKDPTHYQAAISYLQSPSGDSFCIRSPGKGSALIYALAGILHPDIKPYLMGVLNSLGRSISPNEELMRFIGCELMCASDLVTLGLSNRTTFPRDVTSLALDTFSRLSCFSLSKSPELIDWIKFFNQELDKLHVLELTHSLAERLNRQHSLSGYEHITAVLKECREQNYALERLNRMSKATVRSAQAHDQPPEGTTSSSPQEIPASFVITVSLIPAGLQLLAGSVTSFPQLLSDTTIGLAIALVIREIVNARISSKQNTERNSPRGESPDVVSWNNFFEKFDSSDYSSMLKID